MYCNKCGNELDDKSEFCSKCGTKIGNVNEQNVSKNKKHFVIPLCIIVAIVIGICVFISISFTNYKNEKQEEANRKTKEEIQGIYDVL